MGDRLSGGKDQTDVVDGFVEKEFVVEVKRSVSAS